jgi:hypothetical protein
LNSCVSRNKGRRHDRDVRNRASGMPMAPTMEIKQGMAQPRPNRYSTVVQILDGSGIERSCEPASAESINSTLVLWLKTRQVSDWRSM